MNRLHPKIRISVLLSVGFFIVTVLATGSMAILINRGMREQALLEAGQKAQILLDRNMATHTYFSQIMKPRLLEWSATFRSPDYFDPSWMSSTYAVRQIDTYFQSLNAANYYIKDAAVNARYPGNEADEYERSFMRELNQDPKLEYRQEVRIIGGQSYLAILRRGEVMEESCLVCHGNPADAPGALVRAYGAERSFNRRVGELVSVISIRVPVAAAFKQADRFSLLLSVPLVLVLAFLFFAQFWTYRRMLLVPLKNIRNKALQIANDEAHLGEEIPAAFGREMSELTTPFNTMSVRLRSSRDHLEERIIARTAELNDANRRLAREVEERRALENELTQERDFAESLIDTAQTIILILDPGGRIVRFNPYMERISGYSLAEVKGADWFDTFLPERDRARIRELFAHSVADMQTVGNINFIVTKDGREREIEWYDKSLKTADGKVAGLLCIGQDITERKRAEDQQRSLQQQMEFILGATGTGIDVIDASHNVRYVDSEWQKVYGDPNGRKCYEYFMGQEAACPECGIVQTLETKQRTVTEQILPKEGNRAVQVTTIPFQNERGEWLVAEVNADITARKEAEEKRQSLESQVLQFQSQERLGLLAGGIAHDFNNMLMIILGNTDIALRHLSAASPVRIQLEDIKKAAQRAASIADRMAAYSGTGDSRITKIDLGEAVREMVPLLESTIPRNVHLKTALAHDLPPINADAAQIRQLGIDLVINASEAIEENTEGEVVVETGVMECGQEYLGLSRVPEKCPPGRYVFLRVQDSGCGMEEETMAKLFDPFYSTKFVGRGLGLAAVLGIVQSHRGGLMVESEVGKGSIFTVLFPSPEDDPSKAGSSVVRDAPPPSQAREQRSH